MMIMAVRAMVAAAAATAGGGRTNRRGIKDYHLHHFSAGHGQILGIGALYSINNHFRAGILLVQKKIQNN